MRVRCAPKIRPYIAVSVLSLVRYKNNESLLQFTCSWWISVYMQIVCVLAESRQSTVTWLLRLSTINVVLAVPFVICWLCIGHVNHHRTARDENVPLVPVPILISATKTDGNDLQRSKSVHPFMALIHRIWRVSSWEMYLCHM